LIPQIIENEIKRQQELIEKGEKPKKETRVANEDGTTEFTRPLPGGERLYPETDLETIIITKEFLSKIKIPETWEEKSKRFSKLLPKEMIDQVLRSEYLNLFEKYSKENDPILVANTLTSIVKDLRRRRIETEFLTEELFEDLFSSLNKKLMSKEAIPTVLEIVCKEKVSVKEAIGKSGLRALDEKQLREIIRKIFAKYPNLVKEKKISALMGEVMKEVRGAVDGKTVSKVLNEELK
jgi:glutamyl-tRNA(Gln) amidotransferase subunit E